MENIERTEIAQRAFDSVCPDIGGRDVLPLVRHIMQSIIAESPYKPDMEWQLWDAVRVLEDENGLPHGVTADDVFQCYLRVFHGEE